MCISPMSFSTPFNFFLTSIQLLHGAALHDDVTGWLHILLLLLLHLPRLFAHTPSSLSLHHFVRIHTIHSDSPTCSQGMVLSCLSWLPLVSWPVRLKRNVISSAALVTSRTLACMVECRKELKSMTCGKCRTVYLSAVFNYAQNDVFYL